MNMTVEKSAFGHTVADITRLFRRVFDRRAAHLELTRAQWRALSRIERREGLSQSELAEDLEMEAIAVGRVIDRLESAGFIERRPDPADRRCWRLHLLPKSDEVMRRIKRVANTLREDVLGEIDPVDFATTMRVLGQIKDNLTELDRQGRQLAPRSKGKS